VRDYPGLSEYKAEVLPTQPRHFFVALRVGKKDFKKVVAFMAVTTLV